MPTTTRFEVLSALHGREWTEITAGNLRLNASKVDGEASPDVEAEVFNEAAEIIGEDCLVGSRFTVIGLGRTATDETFRLISVTGDYRTVTSIPVGDGDFEGFDPGDDILALDVRVREKLGASADYYFPLDPAALASVIAEVSDEEMPYIVSFLRKRQRMIRDYIESPDFEELDEFQRRATLSRIEEDVGNELADIYSDDTVAVVCNGYSKHTQSPGSYSVSGSKYGVETVAGDKMRVVLQDDSGEIVVKLRNGDTNYLIRAKDVVDILSGDDWAEIDDDHRVDELDTVGQIHQVAERAMVFISSSDFYKLPIALQVERLRDHEREVKEHLSWAERFLEDDSSPEIEVRVSAFFSQSEDTLALGWNHPLVLETTSSNGDELVIFADSICVCNPDLDNIDPDATPFASSDDFALSDGEPMVRLYLNMAGVYSLVRARDIVSVEPILEQ